ncbi:Dihydroneopterin 2',3'-cyclic phosphate phosphodiesterase [uncultured archaeon]|nr:Dihydroneopterin 2',3'-cyclic phosphate phosphodiesterase [uncultured archaeon]
MQKTQFINELSIGDDVDSLFSIKYKYNIILYKNGFMFLMGLSDRTGDIEAIYWGGNEKNSTQNVHEMLKEGDIVHVTGKVGEYKNKLKIDIKESNIDLAKQYNIEDFIVKSKENVDALLSHILKIRDSLHDGYLKKLLNDFLTDQKFIKDFKTAPAALAYHHAYTGGLLEHSLNVAKICETLSEIYPNKMNRDLMIVGAILHDIGKIIEYKTTTNIKITENGILLGHITSGVDIVLKKIEKIPNFPELTKNKLIHILLSHHGKKENGSPIEPSFPEAVAVYYADEADAKIKRYIELIEKANGSKEFYIYDSKIGNIFTK